VNALQTVLRVRDSLFLKVFEIKEFIWKNKN
jgi:hypothetical protein